MNTKKVVLDIYCIEINYKIQVTAQWFQLSSGPTFSLPPATSLTPCFALRNRPITGGITKLQIEMSFHF